MTSSTQRRALGEVLVTRSEVVVRDLFRDRRYRLISRDVTDGEIVELDVDGDGVGDIVVRLAPAESAKKKLYELLRRYGISPIYPPEVLSEAERCVRNPGLDDPGLQDLTDLPFVTIDNDDSRDLDQALFIASTDRGGFRVDYALADASYYVRPGTALFREALRRGASYYLPGLAVPMLPPSLSEGIISLNPDVLRRAVVLRMSLDADGQLLGTEVVRARIRSRAKLSYNGVQRFHDDPASSPLSMQSYGESLLLLREVGELRIADAKARDVVSYNRTEAELDFADAEGRRFSARNAPRNDVERWNEQISLLCNIEGARILSEAGDSAHVQAVYRVHPSPTREALASLQRAIEALVRAHGLDEKVWRWRSRAVYGERGVSLADYLESLPEDDESCRIRCAIEQLALHISQAASFSVDPGPHFGVGAEGYSRISAPMREIVGIFTHKELLERLDDPQNARDNVADEALRVEIIEAGNQSRVVQREIWKRASKLVIDQLLEADLALDEEARPWRAGTILRLRPTRLYVQLDDPPIELKVYCRHLGGVGIDTLTLDESGTLLEDRRSRRRFALGDGLSLRVRAHDPQRERWLFDIKTPQEARE